MDFALLITAALMGLAGTPHCAAMCGAACVAVGGGAPGWSSAGFQLGRLASYAAAGAVAAGSVQWLGRLGEWTPLLKPLWIAVHVAALMLGAWLLVRGTQPRWVQQLAPFRALPETTASGAVPVTWGARARGPARAGVAGLLWVAWPCGLLQSALMVAALAAGAVGGAAVMGAFAMTSSLGLIAAPWLLRLVARGTGEPARAAMTRVAGALLAAASLWALGHGLWHQVAAWCAA
jgi:sulfite exporter TauE/SafE